MYLYCRNIEAQVLNCLTNTIILSIAIIISVLALRLIQFDFYYMLLI